MPLPINPNPYIGRVPEAGIPPRVGLDTLGAIVGADNERTDAYLREMLANSAATAAPPSTARGPAGPDIGISADGSQYYVQGHTFGADDADNIVRAEALLNQPGTGRLPAGFQRLDPAGYQQITSQIKNPSGWELTKKSFGTGVDVMQQNWGRAAQAFNESFPGVKPGTGWGVDMAEANAE
ncbi:MAG TPA: hypothetical protein VHQ87_03920, partial [Rhizobacter sp.]|nr:hypothetical protein [Rhizobacter sp.]